MATPLPKNSAAFTPEELAVCLELPAAPAIGPVTGVTTDSRQVGKGSLFVAIEGERIDGHRFVRKALEQGAAAAVVHRAPEGLNNDPRCLVVPATHKALGALGKAHAKRWRRGHNERRLVAITGSAGKTTSRHACELILKAAGYEVCASRGNLNNAIGVPHCLLMLSDSHDVGVFEIGTSEPGAIAYGMSLVEPDISAITLVSAAHTEGLGSLAGVAHEKGAVYRSLSPEGTLLCNVSDPWVKALALTSNARRWLSYGQSPHCQLQITELVTRPDGHTRVGLCFEGGAQRQLTLPIAGRAGAYALALALSALWAIAGQDKALSLSPEALEEALGGLGQGQSGKRLQLQSLSGGRRLLDDSYNANPASMYASIEAAAAMAGPERLLLVLGEMRELGALSVEQHAALARELGRHKPAWVGLVGNETKPMAAVLASQGTAHHWAETSEEIVEAAQAAFGPNHLMLLKGSRGVALEHAARRLRAAFDSTPAGDSPLCFTNSSFHFTRSLASWAF